jgi:hypothetical protein
MPEAYAQWIDENYPTQVAAFGACHEATDRMVAAFPELRQVRGYYVDRRWGEREHWWCVDPAGQVVDPTARQFPSRGYGEYVELDPTARQPTGKCPECGGYAFDGETFCSEDHKTSYMAYLAEAAKGGSGSSCPTG